MQYPTHFIFNSDYPFDMVVYYKYYVFTTNSSKDRTDSFAHNLGFAPLLFGIWSPTEDFSKSYPLTDFIQSRLENIGMYVESDDSNIYVSCGQSNPVTPGRKLYVKIYGFAPTTWTGDCAPTAQSSSSLLLDTDLAYSPLLAAGAVNPKDMTQGGGQSITLIATVGKNGYQEINGRDSGVALYYQEPLSPTVMMWKTTASTGRTILKTNTVFSTYGFANTVYPYAQYLAAGVNPNDGQRVIQINTGSSRPGQANYDDITHFRVYG